ncbi:MAG: ATP-dependent RecD-like DNA helicase [Chlamydiia bacterium]|nr:ATP-dependent RecD-like DNA helicase [Chlamydiia bacterium]
MDELSGFIDTIVFASEESGFTVARLKTPRQKDLITVVGSMPGVNPGETLHCRGIWKHHPRHGRQFEVDNYDLSAPVDLLGIQRYLESGMVKGVGPVYAKRIVDAFGVKTLDIIDQSPYRLQEVEGIGTKRIQRIEACWSEQKSIRGVMIFLQAHKVRPSFAQKIFKRYGEESIDKVKENPYALAKEIYGIGFKTADELAQNLGIAKDSPIRIKAGIEHVLWELSNEGHVCFPKEDFIPEAEAILEVEGHLIEKEIGTLELEGHLMQEELEGKPHLWVRPLYNAEWGVARELMRVLEAPCKIRPILVEPAIEWAQEKHRIRFAKEQKIAIGTSLEEKLHIITGGPGTGKSTITRAILSITSKVTDKIILAAPTGRAAKRMTEITGKKAFTIHSLLEYDFQEGGFKRNRENPLTARLLIIDEASMIDTLLMYHLLKAIPDETRVIFIGDIDQLPSVGAGNVLKDMIDSKTLPMTRLKWIFRQGKGSRIVANAHRINAGYFPETKHEKGSDFVFFNVESPEEILAKIVDLITYHIPEKFPFDRIDDIQVLSPMKRGVIGTDNLNHALQQRLNPQQTHLIRMGRSFNLHDKVMQIRNNYDKKVYNGDVGRIDSIDMENQTLVVNFDGKRVDYDFCDIDELMLAYAVSIHKYQGSECPCVIIPVHTSHFKLLFRNLLYTGITRGKKLVILLGTKKALAIAVKTDNVNMRHTGLKFFLTKYSSRDKFRHI